MKNIKNYEQFLNEGAESSPVGGSGTAVGGGAQGSFTSSAGVAVYGGDSGSAFATNSSISGMGPIVSAQPSATPGSVWGKDGTSGSGDIGGVLGPYTKLGAGRKKRTKKRRSYAAKGAEIDKFYVSKYSEKNGKGKIITSWKTFNDK